MPRIGASGGAASGSGTGDVTGPGLSTDKAIARWNGITGQFIQDSPGTKVQDGGAVQAQAVIVNRVVSAAVQVPSNYSMLASNIEISLTGSIVIEANAEVRIL